jgi:hypothetical protein
MKFRIPDCQLSRIDKNPPAHPAADPLVESSISAEPTSLKSVAQCTASSAQFHCRRFQLTLVLRLLDCSSTGGTLCHASGFSWNAVKTFCASCCYFRQLRSEQ